MPVPASVPLCEPCVPRAKNAAATRESILTAARQRFLLESYDNVGLREIAGDAGVDVALVSRYFGGKEKLFAEVLGKAKGNGDLLPPGVGAAELPAFLTRLFMDEGEEEHRRHAEHVLILLRSVSSPNAAHIVREALGRDILQPLAERLQGEDAQGRASMAMAVWFGATVLRTIMSVEPMCTKNCEVMEGRILRLYQAALSNLPTERIDRSPKG